MKRFFTGHICALALCLGLFAPSPLHAADITPATQAEVNYWRTLQGEIAALRSANSSLDAKYLFQQPLPEINATMARVEDFLDRRDDDPVDDLEADFRSYREQLMAMLDSALNPIRASAKLNEAGRSMNVQERMAQTTRYLANMRLVDEFKPGLARQHEALNARIVAAGGPRIFFFQNLNFGDAAVLSGNKLSPLERDKQFVEESTAIDPGLGALAESKFLVWRRDGRIDQELEAKRDQILNEITTVQKNASKVPTAGLEKELGNLPEGDASARAIVGAAIRLELVQRQRKAAYALKILDWKSAFARWLGQATSDTSIWEACRDVVASNDGSRYAYSIDGQTVTVRSTDQNTLVAQTTFDGDVRGLAYGANHKLLVFTTLGLFEWDDQADESPQMRNPTASPNISGRIATAADRNRSFYVWANLPELAENGKASTFRASGSSSISSLAMDPTGRYIAIGYTGRNNLGTSDEVTVGVNVLALPDQLGDGSITSNKYNPPYIETVTSIAFDAGATHLAMATNDDGRGTIAIFDREKGDASRRVFALDNQPYHYITFLSGDTPRVLAAARNGIVRIWDLATGDLVQRFPVPTGPQGVAVGLVGQTLVSVALGSESIVRWDLNDITQPIAVAGPAPAVDAAAIAAALKTERSLQPTQAKLVAFSAASTEEETKLGRDLLQNHGEQLDLLDRRRTVEYVVGNNLANQIEALYKAKKYTEAVQVGQRAIADGFGTRNVYYELIYALRGTSQMKDATKATETALELFPTSREIRYLYHTQRKDNFTASNEVDAAMKEIDEIGNIYPEDRPNSTMRQGVWLTIASKAHKAGLKQDALNSYIKALDLCRTKEDQLRIIPTVFGVAYELKNWKLAANAANMWLNADPNKKNDQQFLKLARYAYSQSQK